MSRLINAISLESGLALPGGSALGLLRCLAALQKFRIGSAIAFSGLAGLMLALGRWPEWQTLLVFTFSVLIAAGGAGSFNHYFDRDIDALMGRTRQRPFASGQLASSIFWPLAFFLQMLAGSALAMVLINPLCGLLILAGALTYALVYTAWLKRRNHWNIVIGGAAGSWAVLAGAAAGGQLFDPAILWLTVVLFLWTPSHFWSLAIALEDDYREAGVPMLPVTRGPQTAAWWNLVNTAALLAASLLVASAVNHPISWLGIVLGGGWLGWWVVQTVIKPERQRAFKAFKASLVQLGVLLLSLMAATAWP